MKEVVVVQFDDNQRQEITVHGDAPRLTPDEARQWLEQQFLANDCEFVRATGKVLNADKILVLAGTVGPQRLAQDPAFAQAYARAVTAALGRPLVKVDVPGYAVSY